MPRAREHASSAYAARVAADAAEFADAFDDGAPPVGPDLAGHDVALSGPKVVLLDAYVLDLLNVDTSAQTFQLKLLLNADWEDDGTLAPEVKAKRKMGGAASGVEGGTYRTGKYALREECQDEPQETTWNPEVVLVNAMADEDPIEAGSTFHSIQMLNGRPVISRSVLYQPECRCEFTFEEFPFDETDLVVKFSSNKWSAEQVEFVWSHRLRSSSPGGGGGGGTREDGAAPHPPPPGARRASSVLSRSVDRAAVGGIGLSEFEIVQVRVTTEEKDVHSMQRYDNAQGAFGQAHLIIRVRRDPYSYLLRVASVAELLMILEVLSFWTDNGDDSVDVDLPARFSISGTIFLAMVSLYGPMADSLPKVSVVTRVDKWHLKNFALLFLSNVENLLAFLLRNYINIRVLEYAEWGLGMLYLYMVVKNSLWFLKPLKQREEYTVWMAWLEDHVETFKDKFASLTKAREVAASVREVAASVLERARDMLPEKETGAAPDGAEPLTEEMPSTGEGAPERKSVTIEEEERPSLEAAAGQKSQKRGALAVSTRTAQALAREMSEAALQESSKDWHGEDADVLPGEDADSFSRNLSPAVAADLQQRRLLKTKERRGVLQRMKPSRRLSAED